MFEKSLLKKKNCKSPERPKQFSLTVLATCCSFTALILFGSWTCALRFGDPKTWPQTGENDFSLFSPLTLSLNLYSVVNNKSELTIDHVWQAKSLIVACINLVNMSRVRDITKTVFRCSYSPNVAVNTILLLSPSQALLPADRTFARNRSRHQGFHRRARAARASRLI